MKQTVFLPSGIDREVAERHFSTQKITPSQIQEELELKKAESVVTNFDNDLPEALRRRG